MLRRSEYNMDRVPNDVRPYSCLSRTPCEYDLYKSIHSSLYSESNIESFLFYLFLFYITIITDKITVNKKAVNIHIHDQMSNK